MCADVHVELLQLMHISKYQRRHFRAPPFFNARAASKLDIQARSGR